jgi:hypothetical protein
MTPKRMRSPEARTALLIALLLVVACAGMPGSGQCGEEGPSSTELQAKDVVSALETADTTLLLTLIALHPRLPEAILTTEGVRSLGYAAAMGNTGALRILIGAGAPLDAQDSLGMTPADWARRAGDREVEALLAGTATP